MASRKSHLIFWILSAALVLLSAIPVLAQDDEHDPDPNSPTPVLISMDGTTRALAVNLTRRGKTALPTLAVTTFSPGSKINLYITNIDLMKGEGASAFRVYAVDKSGHLYRFPVLDLQPVGGKEWVYALTTRLADEIGYWEPPTPDGDLLISVTWRGMASNSVKLGYGAIGGIKDIRGSSPTPLSSSGATRQSKSSPGTCARPA